MDQPNENLKNIFKNQLSSFGDSLVIAGSPKKLRMHIHTDDPSHVFTYLEPYGNITFQKVDDMIMQNDIVTNAKLPIGFITDSGCDLPAEYIDKYQIQVVPFKIHFGEQFYLDGLTLKPKEFFKKLDSSPIYPNSAQPSYHDFLNKYDYLSSHFESIIALHLSKNMSGVWSNSHKAGTTVAQQQNKDISVINTKRLASGQGLIVLRAAQAAENGMSKEEIVNHIEKWSINTKQYVSVKTLKYMVKSGRVSPMKGALGKLLNLKPVVTVDDEGSTEIFGKPFTEAGCIKLVMKTVKNLIETNEIWGYAISHANNLNTADYYAKEMEKLCGQKPIYISDAPPALSLNAGPGVVALSIMTK